MSLSPKVARVRILTIQDTCRIEYRDAIGKRVVEDPFIVCSMIVGMVATLTSDAFFGTLTTRLQL